MHLDAGFAVADAASRPEWIAPVDLPEPEGRRQLLVQARQFALERIALVGGARFRLPATAGPQVVTLLEGSAEVGGEQLDAGRSAVVWPGGDGATLSTEGRWWRCAAGAGHRGSITRGLPCVGRW